MFALADTLLDPAQAPAEDLADLYQRRGHAETGIAHLKTAPSAAGPMPCCTPSPRGWSSMSCRPCSASTRRSAT